VAHDHDAGYDFRRAVEIRDASSQIRTDGRLPDIFDPDGSACIACGNNNILQVFNRFPISTAADILFGSAEFDETSG